MAYFPLSVDLTGKTVFLIGNGRQIEDKYRKLLPFGATLIRKQAFTQADAQSHPAMVVAQADGREEEVYALCRTHGIPVNVVDVPKLCSFYFPALSVRGSLTISVSTGGEALPLPDTCVSRSKRSFPAGRRKFWTGFLSSGPNCGNGGF